MRSPDLVRIRTVVSCVLLGCALMASHGASQAAPRRVFINRKPLPGDTLALLEKTFGGTIPDGRYWYDRACGAWGQEGGATLGFTLAELPIGGVLPADISGGGTKVFINGRELHPRDLAGLQQLTGPIALGRYWLDSQGNAGMEGGPPLVNLRQLAQQAGLYRQGGGVGENYGGGGGAYHNMRTGIGIITDGQGSAAVFSP